MARRIAMMVAALALVAVACGDSGGDTTAAAPPDDTAPATTAAPAGPVVQVASSDLGDLLVDGDGNVLYLFTPDAQGDTSACTGDCAETWPPLVGGATAGDGADGSLLGTITRDDGATQPTYNGWPLYYFAADAAPGDTNGQGVGDVWWVIDPSGNAIQ